MKEIWKDIPNYEGLYQASNLGRVKSLPRKIKQKNNSFKITKERIIKQGIGSSKYLYVVLCNGFNNKSFTVHSLIAMAFLNHKPNGHKLVVDHINNIKTDNRLENLQIITHRKNSSKDKKGTSKYTGVSYNKINKKWNSFIYNGNNNINLGSYNTEEEAHEAYEINLKNYE